MAIWRSTCHRRAPPEQCKCANPVESHLQDNGLHECNGDVSTCDTVAEPWEQVAETKNGHDAIEEVEDGLLQLFVLIHGIVGSSHDFDYWEQQMRHRGHKNWEILKVTSITEPLSFPSQINPWGEMRLQDLAEPLVDEVVEWVESFAQEGKKLQLHFVCHSLGGLLVRTALPSLCERLDEIKTDSLEFGHLLTLNSPHIGIQGKRKRYRWKHLVRFKDLHKQVTVQDDERFLERLADPAGEFLPHLARFRHRTAVGATHWDLVVPFCTATICAENPFPRPLIPSLFGSSFCRVDAAIGFGNDELQSLRMGSIQQGSTDFAERLKSHLHDLASDMPERGESNSWLAADDGSVFFTSRMLKGLASAGWRRIAFTLHWTGVNPHTFSIGRTQCEWSEQLVELLIGVLEDGM